MTLKKPWPLLENKQDKEAFFINTMSLWGIKMNDLVSIIEQDNKQWVNARDLHAALGIGRFFANWIKARIGGYGFIEGESYHLAKFGKVVKRPQGGGTAQDVYLLTVTAALIITAGEETDKKPEILGYLARVMEAWNTPEAVRLRAVQMGLMPGNPYLPGSNRPMLEDSRAQLEELKAKKEKTGAFTDFPLWQFVLECLEVTGNRRDFADLDEAYRLYCQYAANPLSKKMFGLNVSYTNKTITASFSKNRLEYCRFKPSAANRS